MNAAKRRFVLSGLKLFDITQMILSFGLATILVVHLGLRYWSQTVSFYRVKLSNCVTLGLHSTGMAHHPSLSVRSIRVEGD